MPLAVAAYIKETGDWDILTAPVTYDSTPGTETPLFEHLQRAFTYTLDVSDVIRGEADPVVQFLFQSL